MINEQQKERQETIYHYVFHAACSAGNKSLMILISTGVEEGKAQGLQSSLPDTIPAHGQEQAEKKCGEFCHVGQFPHRIAENPDPEWFVDSRKNPLCKSQNT